MSDGETVQEGRELRLAYGYLYTAERGFRHAVADGDVVDVDVVEMLIGNALSAFILARYAHPEESQSAAELKRVGRLLEEDGPAPSIEEIVE